MIKKMTLICIGPMFDYAILVPFQSNDEWGYLSIHPEMYPAIVGIAPSGRYFVYCLHPVYGSCHLVVEQNKNYLWVCNVPPPFITEEFIWWIGGRIEEHNRETG